MAVLPNVWSPTLDTQGCVISGFTPTCSCPTCGNRVTPPFYPDCSREFNHSNRAWTLRGWTLQNFQTVHLYNARITCNRMTTLHSILSGLSVFFVFMYVCTLSKSNKIFFFGESHIFATWTSSQSPITSLVYHWNGCLINYKIVPA